MRTPLLFLSLLLSLSACVSTSIHDDLPRIRELARASVPDALVENDVDPTTRDDVRHMLAQPLDADAAVRVALANNRELRAAFREMGIARGHLLQAGLSPNPTVGAEFLPERNTTLELRVEYDLTGLILAPVRAHAAGSEVDAARFRAAAAVVATGYAVRAAYYALVAAEQKLAIAQRSLDAFAAARDASSAMLASGNAPAFDAAVQVAAYERARITAVHAELDVAHRREALTRLLGLAGGEVEWRTSGVLPDAPTRPAVPEHLEAAALEASLELKEQRSQLETLGRQAGLAHTAGWMPEVVADVHTFLSHPDGTAAGTADDWRVGAGVRVGLPVFAQNQGAAVAFEAEFDAQMERYVGTAVNVRSAAREARDELVSAHCRLRQYTDVIVPAQSRVMEQALLQYDAMQLGIFQLLEARREQLDVELARADTLAEYWTAKAALDAVLAGRSVRSEEGGH